MPRHPLFRHRPLRSVAAAATAALAFTAAATAAGVPAAQAAGGAPGAPGAVSHFGLARKDCLGTSRGTASRTWFTVAGGVLSDVYYPTVDNTEVETLQYVVTDGSTFTDLQSRDTTYTVSALDPSGMSCRVVSTAKNGRYTITTDYLTDPGRASVVLRTRFAPAPGSGLQLYVRFDPNVNGNGGGGAGNGGADNAVVDRSTGRPVPVSSDTELQTNAANRDYAQPVYAALQADRAFPAVSSGYAGTASDGLAQLAAGHALGTTYDTATGGNVVQTARVDTSRGGAFTLALGFGATRSEAVATSGASARANTDTLLRTYAAAWAAYDRGLNPPPTANVPVARRAELAKQYYLSANVLKASEDKTFPGAVVASLASPWGQAVSAGDPANTYFGSYREVFARDLYETFTGLLASGDRATATDTVRFLFTRQQQTDGSFPRNSLVNGQTAPDSFGVQLDEVAYPLLMARTVGLTSPAFYRDHLKRAADFLVAHGPAFGNERWEEQAGYSPSTIAAEIAGLTAVAAVAEQVGDQAGARSYRATADTYQRGIKTWTLTHTGPLSADPYFLRLSKNGDPNAADVYNLGNGGPDSDQRAVVDNGFLELPRLGILKPNDPDVVRSLQVTEPVLARTTASGRGFYRYGVATPGTEDGYGDCNVGDPTDCSVQGKPWAGVCDTQVQNKGSGHVWPVLSGERAENLLARGFAGAAGELWAAMGATGSGVGLIPEQAWENPDQAASPPGTAPECASIGFQNGKAAGSASPLTWSEAQFVRLAADLRAGGTAETPVDTTARYLEKSAPAAVAVTITSPSDAAQVHGSVLVTGTTAPRSRVDVSAVNIDADGTALSASTTAGADGSYSVTAPVPPGTTRLTVAATSPTGGTGIAAVTVVDDVVPGTLVMDVTDPDGDDNGPGTYAYPTAGDFKAGAYDLQRFQVYDSGPETVTFRAQTRDLTATFGSTFGAQLLDLHVFNPTGGATSTAASFPQRNYTVAPWNRLIEVQGFGQRFVDAEGRTLGAVQTRGNATTRYITWTVSKAALGGTPGPGWNLSLVLAGQDGFSPDGARAFARTAEPFTFGVCTDAAVAAGNPLCAVDPATVPKAMDVLTPAGTSQADELDPRQPPVTIAALPVG